MAQTVGLTPYVAAALACVEAGRSAVVVAPPAAGVTTLLQRIAMEVNADGGATQFLRFPDPRFDGAFPGSDARGHAVLVVDDAHRATELQALTLRDLAVARPVVLGVRSGAAPEAVSWLWRSGLADRIDLDPLDADAIESIIDERLGGPVHWTLVAGIMQRSGGRPGFAVDEVEAMRRSGAKREAGFVRDRAADRVDERLVERAESLLAELPDPIADVVRFLAVAGSLPDTACERHAIDVQDLLRRAIAERTSQHRVRLVPPALAPAVRATLTPAYVEATSHEILDHDGHHLEPVDRARLRLDLGAPLELAEITAAAWAAVAGRSLASVVALARSASAHGPAGMLASAELLTNVGNRAEAAETYARLLVDEHADPGTKAIAATEYASLLLWDLGRPAEAVRIAAALTSAAADGPFAEPAALHEAGMLMYSGRPAESAALLSRIDRRALDDQWRRVHDLIRVVTRSFVDPVVPADHDVTVLTAVADVRVGNTFGPAVGVIAVELADELAGAWTEAAAVVASARRDLRLDRSPLSAAWLALAEARAALATGRLSAAARAADEAAASFADINHSSGLRWAVGAGLLATAQSGDSDACREHADRFASLAPGAPFLDADLARARAWGAWALGDSATAAADFRDAIAIAASARAPALEAVALHDSYRVLRAPVGARLEELAGACAAPSVELRARHVRLVAEERPVDLVGLAAEFADRGATLLAAEVASDAATIATEQGRRSTAREAEGLRAKLVAACGGAATPALAGRRTSELTSRERDIATRAAAGRSSKGIADDLGLSVRTVDNVLQRVYIKLGVHGRTELPSMIGDV